MHFPQYWPKVEGIKERSAVSLKELWKRQGCAPFLVLASPTLLASSHSLERPADFHFEQGSL